MKSNAKKLEAIKTLVMPAEPFKGYIDDLVYWVRSRQDMIDQIKKILEAK